MSLTPILWHIERPHNLLLFSETLIIARYMSTSFSFLGQSLTFWLGIQYALSNFISYQSRSPPHQAFVNSISSNIEPTTYEHALSDSKWCEAMQNEFSALQSQNSWSSVPPSANHQPIRKNGLFHIKYKSNGSIE